MNDEEILFDKTDRIGTITLNRPERKNAFTLNMIDKWSETLVKWRNDPEVEVIIVMGAGKNFCSGVDLSIFRSGQREDDPLEFKSILWDRIHRIALTLEDIDKPVIAAIEGVAIGAGMDLALMCDLRFASDTARFSEGYIKVGFVPGDGGAYYLPRLVGIAKALELFWTGDFIDAQEAFRIGMINRVYPSDQLMEQTRNFAKKLAEGPSTVIRMVKRATYQSYRADLRTALDLISSHMGILRYSKETQDALKAMIKRLGEKNDD